MIIIPARLASTRLPNKLLLPLGGLPVIVRTANLAKSVDDCVVACDDEAIFEVCRAHKIDCVMTAKTHQSGTDRCAEAAKNLGLKDDEIVINLQGDEPFLEPGVIAALKNALESNAPSSNALASTGAEIFMASCCKNITNAAALDPNLVKVVLDSRDCALYFSRSPIPFRRRDSGDSGAAGVTGAIDSRGQDSGRQDSQDSGDFLGHIGIYGFKAANLAAFCALEKSPLENIEKLEQLRALWHSKKIQMVRVESDSIGIDTALDYQNAQKIIETTKKGSTK